MDDFVLTPGMRIANRYEIRRLLGSGGMAHVYCAWDETLCREIALKTIRFDRATDARSSDILRARLLREAQAAAKLNHSNIVVIHDLCFSSDTPYISMEFVAGKNLRELFHEIHRIALKHLISIARQIASALDFAHSRDVIHRDIKPENVMITPDFTAKITDFGIARVQSPDFSTLTTDGKIMCTYHYTAPEYFKGEKGSAQGDLFSFGCLLYELFTGQLAFSGDSEPQVWWQIMHSSPVAPSAVNPALPPAIDPLILELLNRSPDLRPDSCTIAMDRIETVLNRIDIERPIVPEFPVMPSETVAGQSHAQRDTDESTTRVDSLIPRPRLVQFGLFGALLGVILSIAFWWIGNRVAPRGLAGGAIPKVQAMSPAPAGTSTPEPFHVEQSGIETSAVPASPTIHVETPSPQPTQSAATPRPPIRSPHPTPSHPSSPTVSATPTATASGAASPSPDTTHEIRSQETPHTERATPTATPPKRRDDAWVPF